MKIWGTFLNLRPTINEWSSGAYFKWRWRPIKLLSSLPLTTAFIVELSVQIPVIHSQQPALTEGVDLIDLLWVHSQYRGLYKNVAMWPWKVGKGHPYVKSSGGLMVGVFAPSFDILPELCAEIRLGNQKFRCHWGTEHFSEELIFSNFLHIMEFSQMIVPQNLSTGLGKLGERRFMNMFGIFMKFVKIVVSGSTFHRLDYQMTCHTEYQYEFPWNFLFHNNISWMCYHVIEFHRIPMWHNVAE